MDTSLAYSTRQIDELTFHQVEKSNRKLGICADLATLTTPMVAHRHDFLEIAFATRGRGMHEDIQGRLPLLAGNVWIVEPGQWHAYPQIEGNVSIFNLLLSRQFCTTYDAILRTTCALGVAAHDTDDARVDAMPVRYLHLSPQALEYVLAPLLQLANETHMAQGAGQLSLCVGLVLQILGLLDRYGTPMHTIGEAQLTTQCAMSGLLAAVQQIEEQYQEPLTLEMIAHGSGYTPTYLIRKFRQSFGVSPIDYLLSVRLQHACARLKTTRESITTIAYAVGFSDSRYFATRFRQAFGITPSTFRNQSSCDTIPNMEDKILKA